VSGTSEEVIMSRQNAFLGGLIGALLGGDAVHWFVGGEYTAHTPLRNGFVAVQLAVGLGASLWYAWQARGAATGQDTTATGTRH
jgi:hypothetical protein